MQLERPDIWQRLMSRPGARLLMLGTPNGGSWAPMQVLSGDDTFGNALAAFGSPLRRTTRRAQLMAEMPGFIQLQADLLDAQRGLDQRSHLAQAGRRRPAHRAGGQLVAPLAGEAMQDAYVWGVPPQAVLDHARALRERLDQQCRDDLPAFADKLLLVVGHAKFTPDGFEWTDRGPGLPGRHRRRRRPRAAGSAPAARRAHLDAGLRTRQPARRQARLRGLRGAADAGRHRQLQLLAPAAGTRGAPRRRRAAAPPCRTCAAGRRAAQLSALPAQSLRSVFDSDRRPAAEAAERRARCGAAGDGAQRQPELHPPAAAGGPLRAPAC